MRWQCRSRLALCLWILLASGPAPNCEAAPKWVTLQDCHYLTKRANDGDSFHVSVSGREYIFRLYFVDAPETSAEFRDRVEEQAKYFGITVEQNLKIGELAKIFTRERLSHPFTVHTCGQDAPSRSRLPRSYAFVQTNSGDLGEQLVENGLARVHGAGGRPEDLGPVGEEWKRLTELQDKAKREKTGGWGGIEGRLDKPASDTISTKGVDPVTLLLEPKKNGPGTSPSKAVSESSDITKLDVNKASSDELQNISGIGPVMAGRIMAARPFKTRTNCAT